MLPIGDHTPADYELPVADIRERVKAPLRQLVYPFWNAVANPFLARRYRTPAFLPDLWQWGQRGNDYVRQRRRVDRLRRLRDAEILVAGCGTGRDIESWLGMKPSRVVGVDWFRYDRAWDLWQDRFLTRAKGTEVVFTQGDLAALEGFGDASFDVVGSDAVFEHLRDLPGVLKEFHRVLRPGGVLYATFGPLWYAWGGDHVSGYDALGSGFNHLLLDSVAWHDYLDRIGDAHHSEHDGRTWIAHDLFSRLRPAEYLRALDEVGFVRRFVGAIIDPRAVACLSQYPEIARGLRAENPEIDLIVTGMTIVYERR